MTAPLPPGAVPIASGLTLPPKVRMDLRETQEMVYARTVPILVDCEDRDKWLRTGTRIVIEIGSRTFVASAGHVIEERPHVLFGPNPRLLVPCEPTKVRNRQYLRTPDVGFLEVAKDSHHRVCDFESLTDSPPPENTLMLLVGHPIHAPGSLNDAAWRGGNYYELVRTTHGAAVKEVHEERYVFPFPKKLLNLDSDTSLMTDSDGYETPEGFSGGGVWAKRNLDAIQDIIGPDTIIHAGNTLRLYAIDYSRLDLSRLVNCVPIRYWVRLVYDHYADLREVIEKQFPKIKEVML